MESLPFPCLHGACRNSAKFARAARSVEAIHIASNARPPNALDSRVILASEFCVEEPEPWKRHNPRQFPLWRDEANTPAANAASAVVPPQIRLPILRLIPHYMQKMLVVAVYDDHIISGTCSRRFAPTETMLSVEGEAELSGNLHHLRRIEFGEITNIKIHLGRFQQSFQMHAPGKNIAFTLPAAQSGHIREFLRAKLADKVPVRRLPVGKVGAALVLLLGLAVAAIGAALLGVSSGCRLGDRFLRTRAHRAWRLAAFRPQLEMGGRGEGNFLRCASQKARRAGRQAAAALEAAGLDAQTPRSGLLDCLGQPSDRFLPAVARHGLSRQPAGAELHLDAAVGSRSVAHLLWLSPVPGALCFQAEQRPAQADSFLAPI